jgi:TfoX/Sxy family transcriptional regulator of competence genes
MAFDEDLAHRIRAALQGEPGVSEKRMFGGLGFLVAGHLALSASGQGGLLLRVDPARTEELVSRPHASRAVMRGRELDGWLRIAAQALETAEDLQDWLEIGVAYARSLPPK